MRDSCGKRNVALHVGGAHAVDEAVAADFCVAANGGLDGREKGASGVEGLAAGDEGPADGVAVLCVDIVSGPTVIHNVRDGGGEGVVVVNVAASTKTLAIIGHVSSVDGGELGVARVVDCLGEFLEVRI
jgi:hypothetical protein